MDLRDYQELCCAVLVQAIHDLRGPSKILRRQAVYWFERDNDGPGSFIDLCDVLHFNPQAVRERILRAGSRPSTKRSLRLTQTRRFRQESAEGAEPPMTAPLEQTARPLPGVCSEP